MTAKLIKGTEIRESILQEIAQEVVRLKAKYNQVPGLATILVGSNPASLSYVSAKMKTAKALGFNEIQETLDENISEEFLISMIDCYNKREDVHGILVQVPLPPHINPQKVVAAINPDKDVDGFHPFNIGKLMLGENARFYPCTPAGIVEILKRNNIVTQGKEVVVVGRSNIVGKPIANMLMQKKPYANATVTMVHTATEDVPSHCLRADILIVAVGIPEYIKGSWVKEGACVIDVGVNRVGIKEDPITGDTKALLKGDVEFEAASARAAYITPVPGGIGPMTIAMLMQNTLNSLKFKLGEM